MYACPGGSRVDATHPDTWCAMKNWTYMTGAVVQGFVLGLLLFLALTTLLAVAGDVRLFRYQAF